MVAWNNNDLSKGLFGKNGTYHRDSSWTLFIKTHSTSNEILEVLRRTGCAQKLKEVFEEEITGIMEKLEKHIILILDIVAFIDASSVGVRNISDNTSTSIAWLTMEKSCFISISFKIINLSRKLKLSSTGQILLLDSRNNLLVTLEMHSQQNIYECLI